MICKYIKYIANSNLGSNIWVWEYYPRKSIQFHCFLISQGFSSMIQPLNMVLFLRGQWWFPTRPFQSSPGHMQMRPFATMLHLLEYHPVGIGGRNFEPEIETRLLMEELLHQFICGLSRYPISYDGFYTSPGGCLGFLPSTVWIEICVGWNSK